MKYSIVIVDELAEKVTHTFNAKDAFDAYSQIAKYCADFEQADVEDVYQQARQLRLAAEGIFLSQNVTAILTTVVFDGVNGTEVIISNDKWDIEELLSRRNVDNIGYEGSHDVHNHLS